MKSETTRSFPGVNQYGEGHGAIQGLCILEKQQEPIGDREQGDEARYPQPIEFQDTKHAHSRRPRQCGVATRKSFVTEIVW